MNEVGKLVFRWMPLWAVLLLLGCQAAEPPAGAPPELPVLARPTLRLDAAPDRRLRIPRAAVVRRGGIPGVFVLADGRARFRMIKPGRQGARTLDVLAGLHGNETLVLGGLDEVRDGSPIENQ